MIPIVGFLPGDDLRVVSTIDAIADQLTDERGLLYRYRSNDGLDGRRAHSFFAASGSRKHKPWPLGRLRRDAFSNSQAPSKKSGAPSRRGRCGKWRLLGNFPQASSHVGLVNAAAIIAAVEAGQTALIKQSCR